jgi:hypothetical protein
MLLIQGRIGKIVEQLERTRSLKEEVVSQPKKGTTVLYSQFDFCNLKSCPQVLLTFAQMCQSEERSDSANF